MRDAAEFLVTAARRRAAGQDHAGALVLIDEALLAAPDDPGALALAAELQAIRDPTLALALVQRVLAQAPDDLAAQELRARIVSRLGRHDEAAHRFYALALARPADPLALTNYAVSLMRAGDPLAAVTVAHRAIALGTKVPEAHATLGHAHNVLQQSAAALAAFDQALALRPDYADALLGVARAHRALGAPGMAIAALLRAARIAPSLPGPLVELATLYRECLLPTAADAALDAAAALSPDRPYFASNRLLYMQYDPAVDEDAATAAARAWGLAQMAAVGPAAITAGHDRDPDRTLRIGFVSADLYCHPVGWLGAAAITAHDPAAVSVIVYANQRNCDQLTGRVQRAADSWVPIIGMDDASVAARIAADRIDILVDLSGHTAGHRLGVFARRAAPVQVSWLGYSATTGLPTMDYVLFDDHHLAAADERLMVERVVRLPQTRFCYEPPAYAAAVSAPPSATASAPVFGSFNYTAKLNDATIALWSDVLAAVGNSTLLLKSRGLTDPYLQATIRAKFARCGVEEDRLRFAGHSPHVDMLAQYGEVDVALDPIPFCGGVTSCEALWMGVPVVTLPGRRPFSRQTHAILQAIGRPEWSAAHPAAYTAIAAGLVTDTSGLAEIRQNLRGQMRASPLCDARGFARRLEAVFRGLWREYLNQG